MVGSQELKQWFQKNKEEIRKDFFTFLKFPSISTDPSYHQDLVSCANWLQRYIEQKCGMKAELLKIEGAPLVFAHTPPEEGARTLLVYGHYDVQPVDPLDLWKSDPFDPTERDQKIYARGAVDDKGQIFFALMAMRAWHELGKTPKIQVKFCIEGEEESASVGLSKSLEMLKEKFKADYLLVVDCAQFDETTPAVTLSGRGILATELTLTGSKEDLHSGVHGGIAYNPNRALVELLSQVWDAFGRVQIEGFYDDVLTLSDAEKKKYSFEMDEKSYRKEFGIDAIGGEEGFSLLERNRLRPTLEINGMAGGYAGSGFKTVIPAKAVAKISCRLVPNQDPQKIFKAMETFFKKRVKKGMHLEIKDLGGEGPFWGDPDSDLAKAIAVASEEAMGKKCQKILGGGSIPVIAKMGKMLEAEIAGMGQCLPSDQIHAPNEHFDFRRFEFGFLTFARALELL